MFSRNSLGMILNFSMHSDWELVMLCSPDRKHGSHLVPNELAQPVISSVEKEERTADICEVLQTCSLWKLAERRFSHWKSLSESPVIYPGTSTCLWIDILYHGKGKQPLRSVDRKIPVSPFLLLSGPPNFRFGAESTKLKRWHTQWHLYQFTSTSYEVPGVRSSVLPKHSCIQ